MVGNGGCFCRKICYNPVILFEGEPDLKLSRLVFPPDGASRGTLRAHRAYLAVLLTLLGVGIGFLGLWLTACADAALPQAELYRSYLDHPLLLALNLFPPLLLAWLGYFLSGRCWCGVLLSGLFGVGLPLINYYKVMLRGDPMRASDILLLRTAGGIMSQYEFERTAEVNMAVALLGAMLAFAVLLMPRGDKRRRARALGAAACVLLGVGAYLGAYADEAVYERTANDSLINIWSDNEVYLSRGFALSFLHSVPELFPEKPEGYDARAAQTLLDTGMHRVFISLGSDGVFAADHSGQKRKLPALKGNIVSTTGCGDAFMAALAWAYLQGSDLEKSARAGRAASTVTMASAETISAAMSEQALLAHM